MLAAETDVLVAGAQNDLFALLRDAALSVKTSIVRCLFAAPADGLDLFDGVCISKQPMTAREKISLEIRP